MTTTDNNLTSKLMPAEGFAECAEARARLADASQAGTETSPGPVTPPAAAGATPDHTDGSHGDMGAHELNDPTTPAGEACARAFSDDAAAYVRELRTREPLPDPDRTPGAPHPDPFLASRGWHINQHGIYTRRAHPEPQPPPEPEIEAGS